MATMRKSKHRATKCALVVSPTRSPTISTIEIRRRRGYNRATLKMLLSDDTDRKSYVQQRSPTRLNREIIARPPENEMKKKKKKKKVHGPTLKDLFVSFTPFEETECNRASQDFTAKEKAELRQMNGDDYGGGNGTRPGLSRAGLGWSGFRYRFFIKRTWRPTLISIPE
ncbi:hypothetical protein Ancab_018526 [Ancistrocladus abbreviatus]